MSGQDEIEFKVRTKGEKATSLPNHNSDDSEQESRQIVLALILITAGGAVFWGGLIYLASTHLGSF
jgi:hypothetical protein